MSRELLEVFLGTNALDDRVRQKLVGSLYSQPTSLAIGALCGVATAYTAAGASGNSALWNTAIALTIVGIVRVIAAHWLTRNIGRVGARRLEIFYEIGAFAFALLTGLVAAIAIVAHVDAHIEILTVSFALGYGVGISARNAGRPVIAFGQLLLSAVPIMAAAIIVGTLGLYVLAGITFFLILTMMSITLNVYRVLRESISAAEANAKMAEKMRVLARTDVVTGLSNRAGLNHELVEKTMAMEPGRSLALFWLDLDKFKEVNDMLGHPVGDRVLAEVADRLREDAPQDATVARFGGDEFIVATEINDRQHSERLARCFLESINRPYRMDGETLKLGTSMGIAVLPEDGADVDTLMKSADLALYHAKTNGKNQVSFFDQSMTRDLVRRKEIEAELRAAIERDELSIFFQPIVDLETGRIRSFEALVRWFHPEKGELRPDEFIPVAEETGVIITLGNWITSQAAKACAGWPEDVTIAVNLSPIQIRAPGAALGILNALKEANLAPSRLELEVTESLFLENDDNTTRFIAELASEGVRFALDDFGTGYSSLGYINKYPFSKIKVDRSFVSGPNVGRKSDAIIRAVAEMGSTLEMDIVAEGLETIEQVRAVRNAGCTLGQGYYFSRAVPDYLAAMLLSQESVKDEGVESRRTG
jgi:diguanylate cyclase (GGDEF)-like protein